MCACVGMPVASRRAIDGGGQPERMGYKGKPFTFERFVQFKIPTRQLRHVCHSFEASCWAHTFLGIGTVLLLTRILTVAETSGKNGSNPFFVESVSVEGSYRYEYESWVPESVAGRSIKTSQVALRTNLPACPRPGFYEQRRRRFSTQGRHSASKNFTRYKFVFFFALSAPRTFGKPNSVFKNISASIVLVRERTFYCRPYNVLKVTRFCHAYVFPGVVVLQCFFRMILLVIMIVV